MPAVKGWVGHASSPGTVLAGTGRSSTGKTGAPVLAVEDEELAGLGGLEHDRNAASRPRRMVVSAGGEALS